MRRATSSEGSQFHQLAEYYDPLNEGKDYRGEVELLEGISRKFGSRRRTAWLDVACGTGRHLEWLAGKYDVVGVDSSREMLRVARRRLPGVLLLRGDMRTFRLGRRFDVVSCLFSAIGHLRSEAEVRKTYANFAHHLNPGGVAIVEPWIDPAIFRSGFVQMRTYNSPTLVVARSAASERRGNRSIVRYDFLVGRPAHGVRHYRVVDVGLLVSRSKHIRLMNAVGLRARFIAKGLTPGRGLIVGVKG